jgi:hypothetical protein
MMRDGPNAPTAIHGPFGLTFHLLENARAIPDWLQKQFTHHCLCNKNYERRVEARVQALLEPVDSNPSKRIRPCDLRN